MNRILYWFVNKKSAILKEKRDIYKRNSDKTINNNKRYSQQITQTTIATARTKSRQEQVPRNAIKVQTMKKYKKNSTKQAKNFFLLESLSMYVSECVYVYVCMWFSMTDGWMNGRLDGI